MHTINVRMYVCTYIRIYIYEEIEEASLSIYIYVLCYPTKTQFFAFCSVIFGVLSTDAGFPNLQCLGQLFGHSVVEADTKYGHTDLASHHVIV